MAQVIDVDEISVSSVEARKRMGEMLEQVHYRARRYILTKNGRRLAALISLDDLKVLNEQGRKEARKP